jgi:hypothetical protein
MEELERGRAQTEAPERAWIREPVWIREPAVMEELERGRAQTEAPALPFLTFVLV